jgi:PAS domain S-box-containing protein
MHRSIVNPIQKLEYVTNKISKGQSVKINTHGNDEIHDLAESINQMVISQNKSKDLISSSEKKFKDLYENSPNLLRTIDINGVILDCNEMYSKTLGYSKKETIGSSIFKHIPIENQDSIKQSFEDWKNFGRVGGLEIVMQRNDKTTFPALISASSLYDEKGDLIGSNSSIVDLSEINQAKKEIQQEKFKRLMAIGELSSRIAHDLRNPLSVIKNTVELLQLDLGENQNIKIKNKFDRITRAITRINHQVENVLDFVKEKPLKFEDASLNSILNFVIDKIIIPPNITINMPKNDLIITCDFEKLEIVFINLITNAIQAMSNKGVINIRSRDIGNDYVIEFDDDGLGISTKYIDKIFDPLFTTREIGTGLGLPSCKTIIESHNGKIDVISSPKIGTIFKITLPKIQVSPLISKV